MPDQRFRVTSDPLDVKAVSAIVSSADCGATATFVGLVRNENNGRRVLWLEYEAYEPLAVKAFARIDEEAGERWPSIALAIHHRIGRLEIGEASVIIAAASPHRAEAFAACRYAIERIKQIAPIWKHEHFEGGEIWIEGATADPTDDDARRMAFAQCT
jgi:molybdopterin synthase catalytic subunit